jgi:hypothetical protein
MKESPQNTIAHKAGQDKVPPLFSSEWSPILITNEYGFHSYFCSDTKKSHFDLNQGERSKKSVLIN